MKLPNGLDAPEVQIVALQAQSDYAGKNDGRDERAAVARNEAARQFFNGKHDARQWRVERGGKPGRCPCKRELPFDVLAASTIAPAHGVHERCADLHRGPLTANRKAAEDAQERDDDLAEHDAQGEQRTGEPPILQRRDHLRNATALGTAKELARQPDGQCRPHRRDDDRQPERVRHHVPEKLEANIDQLGVGDGHETHENGTEPEDAVVRPESPGPTR